MPKVSSEKSKIREEEIMSACRKLYETKSFKEITVKEIGSVTTFTRTSIYNYFRTKEEIFLALLKKEYEIWVEELKSETAGKELLTREDFAEILAKTLSRRELLLKVLAMNMYDIEENSRIEKLVEFKVAYGCALKVVSGIVEERLGFSEKEAQSFIYSFFPFILGAYPYANATEKQKKAMDIAGIDFKHISLYDLIYVCASKLLKA